MKLITIATAILLLQFQPAQANDIADIAKKVGKELERGFNRVTKEIKRVEKRVEKEINRTDENIAKLYHKTEDVLEEAWRDTREEVGRWDNGSPEDLAITTEQIVYIWHVKKYPNGDIACRPISNTGQALKHLSYYKKQDYDYLKLRKAGTVISAFTGKSVPRWELRYKRKEQKDSN